MENFYIMDVANSKMKIRDVFNLRILKALFLILCGFQFYMYYALSSQIQFFLSSLSILFLFIISYRNIFRKVNSRYYKLMQWILFSWVICMFNAWAFWGQSLLLSYRATAYFVFIIFFYFVTNKSEVIDLERLIIILGWLYVVLWLYAISRIPEVTFGYKSVGEIEDESRGFFRINFIGRLSLILTYFLYLCKFFVYKKNKFMIYACILFVVLVMQLTRQLILWTGIVTLIYIFLSNKKWAIILALVFVFLYIGSSQIEFSDDSVIGSLINISNQEANGQLYAGENPRITEYKYFFSKWSPNIITDIFGTGVPCGGAYGNYEEMLKWKHKLYLSDVGYGMMFAENGVLGLLLYLWLFIKCVFAKVPKNLRYVTLFMGAMLPMNIAAAWYARADTQVCIAICVYLIYKIEIHKKIKQ